MIFQRKFTRIAALLLLLAVSFLSTTALSSAQNAPNDDDHWPQWTGAVESMPSGSLFGSWVVGGRTFTADTGTRFEQEHGQFQVGSCVKVKYQNSGAGYRAVKIEGKSSYECGGSGESHDPVYTGKAYGIISAAPANRIGTWMIGNVAYTATGATWFQEEYGPLGVGMCAEVVYTTQNGQKIASKIDSSNADHCGSGGSGDSEGYTSRFYGVLNSFPASLIGTWQVSGLAFQTTATTQFNQEQGGFVVNGCVEVDYVTQNGQNVARRIETSSAYHCNSAGGTQPGAYQVYGRIDSYPGGLYGTWLVDAQPYATKATTRFEQRHGLFAVGTCVEINYDIQGGQKIATHIATATDFHCAPGQPAPTATPVVPPTATPVVPPTATPVVPPTATPVVPPTATPVVPPTATPVVPPTATPVVPPTATPVVPPTATPVVPPTATPAPTQPLPTATAPVSPLATPPATGAGLIWQPQSLTMRMGQTSSVSLMVNHVQDLAGYEFTLSFDPQVIQVSAADAGDLLQQGSGTVVPLGPVIDNTNGAIHFGAITSGTNSAVNGSGILSTLTIQAVGLGNVTLQMGQALMNNSQNQPISLTPVTLNVTVIQPLRGDLNADCQVDLNDVLIVIGHWGSHEGEADFDAQFDFDADRSVTVFDVVHEAQYWGNTCNAGGRIQGASVKASPVTGKYATVQMQTSTLSADGATLSVPVHVHAQGLTAFEAEVLYNPAQMKLVAVEVQGLLAQSGCVILRRDLANGSRVGAYCTPTTGELTLNDTVMVLHLRSQGAPPAPALGQVVASDASGQLLHPRYFLHLPITQR